MHQYLIALGSNLGQRQHYIEQALKELESFAKIIAVATTVETPPVGPGTSLFLNTACTVDCDLEPSALLSKLKSVELKLGRVQSERWGDREIDLDIILWKTPALVSQELETNSLKIPHPEAHKREFVLKPASEIAGDWQHPVLNVSLKELYANFIKLSHS